MCSDDCEPQEFNTSPDSPRRRPPLPPRTIGADLSYKQERLLRRLTFLRRCNNIAEMSEPRCRAGPICRFFLCAQTLQTQSPRLRERLSARPRETVSLIIFYQLHRSLFLHLLLLHVFLTNYSQLPCLYLEWEESCSQNLKLLCLYAHYAVRNPALIRGWFLIGADSDWIRVGGWVGLLKVPACARQTDFWQRDDGVT